MLIKYLFTVKKSKHKKILWECFGDVILENLKENLPYNSTSCQKCGKRFVPETPNQKKCDDCGKEVDAMGNLKQTKCEYDGYTFDSIPERDYYLTLVENEVKNLEIHPTFTLQEKFTNGEGKTVRAISFSPDFMYEHNGQLYIVDVKPLNKKLIDTDFTLRWKWLQNKLKDEDIKFRLVAWDQSIKEYVSL